MLKWVRRTTEARRLGPTMCTELLQTQDGEKTQIHQIALVETRKRHLISPAHFNLWL
jgi:hypothetical protein